MKKWLIALCILTGIVAIPTISAIISGVSNEIKDFKDYQSSQQAPTDIEEEAGETAGEA